MEILELLEEYGAQEKSHNQCEVIYFDKKSKQRMAKQLDPKTSKKIEKYMRAYAVMRPDGVVVTTGYRNKRVKKA